MIAWLALAGVVLIVLYLAYDRVTGKAWAEDFLRDLRRKERVVDAYFDRDDIDAGERRPIEEHGR